MNQNPNPRPIREKAPRQTTEPLESQQDNSVEALLDRLDDMVYSAKSLPFSGNIIVDREDMRFLLKTVRDLLPEELRQAKWLLEQNRQLIAEARKEAETIMRDAQAKMAQMIDEHEITEQARAEADHILSTANQSSHQIRMSAINYTRDMLIELEDQLKEMLTFIQRNKKELDG